MRKYVMIAVFAILTILAVGCGSQQGEESNAFTNENKEDCVMWFMKWTEAKLRK